jgi:hypothetical protein
MAATTLLNSWTVAAPAAADPLTSPPHARPAVERLPGVGHTGYDGRYEVSRSTRCSTWSGARADGVAGRSGSIRRPSTADDPRSYADLVNLEGLREVATYADAVGAAKDLVLPRNADGATTVPSSLVDDAHARGLAVHVWTLRDENQFMACRP